MNGDGILDIIYGAIGKTKQAPNLFMATVGELDYAMTPVGSKVFIKFDGTSSNSPVSYPMLASAFPLSIGQRVLVARLGYSLLIVGKVQTYS